MNTNKNKIKIRKGDSVKIISGKFKGQVGKVNSILKKNYLIIENINFKLKHTKPKQAEEKGYIKKVEGPIHNSNVKIINITK